MMVYRQPRWTIAISTWMAIWVSCIKNSTVNLLWRVTHSPFGWDRSNLPLTSRAQSNWWQSKEGRVLSVCSPASTLFSARANPKVSFLCLPQALDSQTVTSSYWGPNKVKVTCSWESSPSTQSFLRTHDLLSCLRAPTGKIPSNTNRSL
jgi:hypothetical protein